MDYRNAFFKQFFFRMHFFFFFYIIDYWNMEYQTGKLGKLSDMGYQTQAIGL
jgi:hypothetical protein